MEILKKYPLISIYPLISLLTRAILLPPVVLVLARSGCKRIHGYRRNRKRSDARLAGDAQYGSKFLPDPLIQTSGVSSAV